jgi:hypothetical protein
MSVSAPEEKKIYFVSKARGCRISGFVKEKKQAGYIDEPEQFLEFTAHLLVTSDKKEAAFIRKSLEFPRMKEFDNAKDAMTYRAAIEKKMETEMQGDISTVHKEDVKFEGKPAEEIAASKIPKQ